MRVAGKVKDGDTDDAEDHAFGFVGHMNVPVRASPVPASQY
jgi:hypothetical protein